MVRVLVFLDITEDYWQLRVQATTSVGQIRAAIRVRSRINHGNFTIHWKRYNVQRDRFDMSVEYVDLDKRGTATLATLNCYSGAEIYIRYNV